MIKRFDEIDVMRIIGFLMVVDQHILGAYAQNPEAGFADSMVLHFLYLLGRPAVPMFVAITGFTLFFANYERLNIREFYKKRLVHIVMPYLFWSFASIVIFEKYYLLKDIILVIATGNASYHLWYMSMSIRIYLWFPMILAILSKVLRKSKSTQKLIFVLFFIAYWVIFKEKNYLTDKIAAIFFETPSLLEMRLIQYSPLFWSIYFVCGAAACLNYECFKEKVLKHSGKIVAVYIPLVIYMYYTQVCSKLPEYFPRIDYDSLLYILYMILTIAVIYIASVKISRKTERLRERIRELGSLSYGAYLIHVPVLQLIAPILRRAVSIESYLVSGIIIFIITSVLSIALCYIIRFLPLSEYTIGVKRRPLKSMQVQTL